MNLPRSFFLLLMLTLALAIAGCSSTGKRGGGYYKDDGPDAHPPSDLDRVPDAVPRIEPLARGANRPYVVFGKQYVPDTSGQPYKQRGIASWYGKKFHGNSTSIGEPYDMYAMTAAHTSLPIPSYARVTSLRTGRSVIVRVNDRGPFHSDRIMDLSYVAAYKLDIVGPGSDEVIVERIMPDEIQRMSGQTMQADSAPSSATGAMAFAPAGMAIQQDAAATPVALEPQPNSAPTLLEPLQNPPPAPDAPPPRQHPAMSAGNFYLQLGAFSQQANAESLLNRVHQQLDAQGGPPALIEQNNAIFRVKIGPYSDRDSAMRAIQTVSDQTGILPSLTTH